MTSQSLDSRRLTEIPRPHEQRSPFDLDRTRILHSAAFRRLQGKTQVLGIGESDFLRTRLTHSIEVANIGRGLLQSLQKSGSAEQSQTLPCQDLIEAISFAHDLGHPPFGHNGEKALNEAMSSHGGFEGNGHTLRLLTTLESRHPGFGLNLTRRTLLGVLKYPSSYDTLIESSTLMGTARYKKPPKCYLDTESHVAEWLLSVFSKEDKTRFIAFRPATKTELAKPLYKTLDCSIMDVADEISYGVHDLEDGIQVGMIARDHVTVPRTVTGIRISGLNELFNSDWGRRWDLGSALDLIFSRGDNRKSERKTGIGAIVHALIGSIQFSTDCEFQAPLLKYNACLCPEADAVVKYINNVALSEVIGRQTVQTLEYRGRVLVQGIFEALKSDPKKLLPEDYSNRHEKCISENEKMRTICDYIAGMTDSYATRMYERLYIPRLGNVFERL